MLSKPSLRYMGITAVVFGSFYVVNEMFGGVGMMLAVAVFIVYLLKTDASNWIVHFFNWLTDATGTAKGTVA